MKIIIFMFTCMVLVSCRESTDSSMCIDEMPSGFGNRNVRIIQVLPNPDGPNDISESITIKNFDIDIINFKGWKITNTDSVVWELNPIGELQTCSIKTIITVFPNTLKNQGDTIYLTDERNVLIQVVSWGAVGESEIVYPK